MWLFTRLTWLAFAQAMRIIHHCYADDTQYIFIVRPIPWVVLRLDLLILFVSRGCLQIDWNWIVTKQNYYGLHPVIRSSLRSNASSCYWQFNGTAIEWRQKPRCLFWQAVGHETTYQQNQSMSCFFNYVSFCHTKFVSFEGHCLKMSVLKTLLHTFVSCRLDYCNCFMVFINVTFANFKLFKTLLRVSLGVFGNMTTFLLC